MREGRFRSAMGGVVALFLSIVLSVPVHAAASACAQIRKACLDAGFVQGGVRSGNGLKIDCVDPILDGKPPARGASLPLPQIDAQLIGACRTENGLPTAPNGTPSVATATPRPLSIYYVLSTWNPYVVILMQSRFQVTAPSHPET
jgi:hypothetical protein